MMLKIFFSLIIIALLPTGSAQAKECKKVIYTAHPDSPPLSMARGERGKGKGERGNKIVGASSDIIKLILEERNRPSESLYVEP